MPVDQQRLAVAYHRAKYRIQLKGEIVLLQVGRADAHVDTHIRAAGCKRHWHLLTACNPASQVLSELENAARMQSLIQELEALPWRRFPSISSDRNDQWQEPGYCLFDADPDAILMLADRYGQAALLTGELGRAPRLVWLPTDCVKPAPPGVMR